MRPPEFTGGNEWGWYGTCSRALGFNEAAGIHRRKHEWVAYAIGRGWACFNEAAGIHRRKLTVNGMNVTAEVASMRPPEFTGGNGPGLTFGSAGKYLPRCEG